MRRGKIEGKEGIGRRNFETGAMTDSTITSSMAEEAENTPSASDNRAHSDGRSRMNECSDSPPIAEGRVGAIQPLYNEDRQELL